MRKEVEQVDIYDEDGYLDTLFVSQHVFLSLSLSFSLSSPSVYIFMFMYLQNMRRSS